MASFPVSISAAQGGFQPATAGRHRRAEIDFVAIPLRSILHHPPRISKSFRLR
jgi:hypothetical protein